MRLNIEIPDDVHKALKLRAVEENTTLRALVIELLRAATEQPRRKR